MGWVRIETYDLDCHDSGAYTEQQIRIPDHTTTKRTYTTRQIHHAKHHNSMLYTKTVSHVPARTNPPLDLRRHRLRLQRQVRRRLRQQAHIHQHLLRTGFFVSPTLLDFYCCGRAVVHPRRDAHAAQAVRVPEHIAPAPEAVVGGAPRDFGVEIVARPVPAKVGAGEVVVVVFGGDGSRGDLRGTLEEWWRWWLRNWPGRWLGGLAGGRRRVDWVGSVEGGGDSTDKGLVVLLQAPGEDMGYGQSVDIFQCRCDGALRFCSALEQVLERHESVSK